ncbi:MAG TPA: UDP-N-acetylenolpyruvoylglucosamine reductase, partial [Corynebacterium variabile]|nr:UDP-N-acetylenolpyruvoylglucosamine reductase [Corynebacterium variabile]
MSSADPLPRPVPDALPASLSATPGVRPTDATFADLTTLRVGGRPAATVECATPDALASAVRSLDDAGVPLLVVGGGSNLVVGDEVDGLVAVVAVTDEQPTVVGED